MSEVSIRGLSYKGHVLNWKHSHLNRSDHLSGDLGALIDDYEY